MRRIAVGGIVHETNTFVPALTDLSAFSQDEGPALVARWRESHSSLGGVLHELSRTECEIVPLLYAAATPGGLVARQAYETLVNHLITGLKQAAPIDGVLLVLHGAMVAEGVNDCEGDILARVRAQIACPVVCVLDMHACLTQAMVERADALVAFNQNPHLDAYDRGIEAAALLSQILEGRAVPTSALARPPLLLSALATSTDRLPLRAVHEQAQVFRQDPRVLNISVIGGFAYSDIPDAGFSTLVTTHNNAALAREIAQTLADTAWLHREAATNCGVPVEKAVHRAINAARFPVVLADIGDNVGGGSSGDGTILLQALIQASAQDAVVVLADHEAVQQAADAGIGAEIDVVIGGKVDSWHGESLRLSVRVERLTDGQFTVGDNDHFANIYGRSVEMGRCARLRHGSITLLLTERRTPPGDLEQLHSQGIPPESQRIIVVKSAIAFRGVYEPIAAEMIEVDTPGLCAANLSRFHYHNLRRPIFLLDAFSS